MNRREFIRGTAAASLIGVSSKILWGADAPSNRVRLCFAGVHEKGRGQEPMRWSARMPGVEIAYVCDPARRAQDWAAAKVNELAGYAPKKATERITSSTICHAFRFGCFAMPAPFAAARSGQIVGLKKAAP